MRKQGDFYSCLLCSKGFTGKDKAMLNRLARRGLKQEDYSEQSRDEDSETRQLMESAHTDEEWEAVSAMYYYDW
jgi:hypothetical protein